VKAKDPLPTGPHLLSMQFEPTGKPDIRNGKGVPANVRLLVDGKPIAEGKLPHTVPIRLGQGGAMLVGMDSGAPVNPEYKPPFRYQAR
jgi:arylsulfatase